MDYENVLEQIGLIGYYQLFILFLLSLCTFYNAMQTLGINILNAHHDHVCDVTGTGSVSYFDLLQVAPLTDSGGIDSCSMYALDWNNVTFADVVTWNRSVLESYPVIPCNQWVFNEEQYESTFTSEVNKIKKKKIFDIIMV